VTDDLGRPQTDAPGSEDEQARRVVDLLSAVLGPDLVGVYLFGSVTLGGLRPRSDLDLFAVSRRRLTADEGQIIVDGLLAISGTPRPLEVTLVVESDVRPWRYPPRREFQFGEWWRPEFESGVLKPWADETDPDLASLVTMVRLADRPFHGPPPHEVLDPVPRTDYARAMASAVDGILLDLENDTRNYLLTLARIWSTLVTGEIRSKDSAADWALERLPDDQRLVLERARAIYLGEDEERWDDVLPRVRAHAEHVTAEIRRATPDSS
jgi:predicted nucleotidyltransferase